MNLNDFKEVSVMTESEGVSKNRTQARQITKLYTYKVVGKTYEFDRRTTINVFGKAVCRQSKYRVNGVGVCKRVFLEEVSKLN